MEKILLKKNFDAWLKLLNFYNIYAPVKVGDIWSYERIENPEDICLDYPNTAVPPKKILFPQREVLMEFESSSEQDVKVKEILPEGTSTVIFGVRSCDARGFAKLEKILKGGFKDNYFTIRNDSSVIVGFACTTPPSMDCFCSSVGGNPYDEEGMDVIMTDMGSKYYSKTVTEKGEKLIKLGKNLFTNPDENAKKEVKKIHSESEKKLTHYGKNIENISSKLATNFNSDFWDKESLGCIRCGICTYSCPVCHCFDINDEVTCTFPLKGKRVRTWDNCQFPDFTMHSSGHNPRNGKASRLRQRIMHKFSYFNENCTEYLCTGCGRCISYCPIGIDIMDVLQKMSAYEK